MLYIVGTSIGNLEDFSLRQARIIAEAEIILTEDSRSTGMLIPRIEQMFSLKRNPDQKFVSYYKEKEFEKLPEVLDMIDSGKNIALVSECGLPLISDPGSLLVKTLIKRNIPFTVIPGPTSIDTALVYSGFDLEKYMFLGFLPKKENDLLKLFIAIKDIRKTVKSVTFAAFESPERINKTLELLQRNLPEMQICIARELTKKFEEIIRGKAEDLQKRTYKGEITLVIS